MSEGIVSVEEGLCEGSSLTSLSGMVARGCTTSPSGMRQLVSRSREQGTLYRVDLMKRGLALPGERNEHRRR